MVIRVLTAFSFVINNQPNVYFPFNFFKIHNIFLNQACLRLFTTLIRIYISQLLFSSEFYIQSDSNNLSV